MGARPKLLEIAPVFVVRDVGASAEYWRDKVGFDQIDLYGPTTHFGILGRDEIRIMIAQAPDGIDPPLPNWRVADKTNQAYIWVDDAAVFYKELQVRGATIDFTLYDTPWGTREFGIQDLDDHDIVFGQVLT